MLERILVAGSGGQGVLLLGRVIAGVAVNRVPYVTFFPAYGAEVRGGSSHCEVILASEEIASPVADEQDWLLIMNQESADRFLVNRSPRARAIINSSLCAVERSPGRRLVPASEEADKLGDIRVANFVMLGAFIGWADPMPAAEVETGIGELLSGKSERLVEMNLKAFRRGLDLAADR